MREVWGHPSVRRGRAVALALAITWITLGLVFQAPAGAAVDTGPCRNRMLTGGHSGGLLGSFAPDLTGDGRTAVFLSNRDLTGGNPSNRTHVFEADLTSGALRQLTSGAMDHRIPRISTDGSTVAFLVQPTPSDLHLDVLDRTSGQRRTVLSGMGLDALPSLELDAGGDHLVVISNGSHESQNADGDDEVWRIDLGTDEVVPVSSGTSSGPNIGVHFADISADGEVITYSSNRQDELGGSWSGHSLFQSLDDQVIPQRIGPLRGAVAVDDAADTIAMTSPSALGGPPYPVELHLNLVDLPSGEVTVLHQGGQDAGRSVALSGDGTTVAFQAEFAISQPSRMRSDAAPRPLAPGRNPIQMRSDHLGVRFVIEAGGSVQGDNPFGNPEVFVVDCTAFRDVSPTHPFIADVEWMSTAGLSDGYADQTFRPGAPVSRQAAVAFLHRLAGAPPATPPTPPTFSDVGAGHPFRDEVEWAGTEGITQGYDDGTFRPLAPVTRQAMAAFLFAYDDGTDPAVATPTFADVPVTHPFATQIEWTAAEGIVNGYHDGTFRPAATVTRQAAAAFLHRLTPLD